MTGPSSIKLHAGAPLLGQAATAQSPARQTQQTSRVRPLWSRRNTLHTAISSLHAAPQLQQRRQLVFRRSRPVPAAAAAVGAGISEWVRESNGKLLDALEEQALGALKTATENFQHPVFPCALIAGDVAILHLLHRAGLLAAKDGGKPPVQVVFIDTFHLFPETHDFLHQLENDLGFKARVFQPAGYENKAQYAKEHGSDLYMTDIEKYDRICKVEPFSRALDELQADVMINGRRRDHGFERAFLEIFEDGTPVKAQPLAYWTFADCFAYLERLGAPAHPLHAQGYPSVGDLHSTVTVPKDKWFEYAGERSGRFQGLTNADGSLKTECGIHTQSQLAESLAEEGEA